jgi:hypothetical protein
MKSSRPKPPAPARTPAGLGMGRTPLRYYREKNAACGTYGEPDPDPLVRDPDLDPSIIKQK